jgi:hypothetical protein
VTGVAQVNGTTTVRDRRDQVPTDTPDPLGEAITGLVGLLWSAISGIVKLCVFAAWAVVGSAIRVLRASLVGKHRHLIAPLWLAAAAGVSGWLGSQVGWYWITVAVAIEATTWRRESRRFEPWKIMSERERHLTARVLALVAGAVDLVPETGLSWRWTASLAALLVLGGAVPWWRWRATRAKRAAILDRWENEVVSQDARFAGDWIDFDPDAGTGVLALTNAPASTVAKLDAEAEFHLDAPAGTVTITDDPRLSRRRVRVTFSTPGDELRFRFWEGPTLRKDGRFVAAYAAGNQPIYGRLWTPDGASFVAIVAPSGSGKGSIQRILILEAALCPDIFTIGIDGKRGKGIGYCRAGFDVYADTPARWREALDMSIAELERRSASDDIADSFVLRPGTPRTFTVIDDLPEVHAACPTAARHLNRLSSQARSLGMGKALAMQHNAAPSYGGTSTQLGTGTRSNVLDNGWLWAGPATDSQARQALKQSFPFDPGSLPNAKGWAALMGKHLGDQPIVPSRTLWIPNRNDITEHGMEAPFGSVEDWLERDTIHSSINDGMREIFFPPAVEELPQAFPAPAPTPVPVAAVPTESDGWSRIVEALKSNPAGMQRGDLAKTVGLSPKHTSDLLRAHSGVVVQDSSKAWRLAS